MTTPPTDTIHVFTLTGNLLAERTLAFAAWSPGRTQRATEESFQVGGKGINVSKMLTRLGLPNTALCFTGGAPGAECEAWLQQRGFRFQTFATRTPTRAGTVVRDRSGRNAETTFLGPDDTADPDAVRACAEFLDRQTPGQVLALCGSFPGWTTPVYQPLHAAIERWHPRGTLVVDSYGPALRDLVRRPLALLKINADELQSLGHADLQAIPINVQRVIVTDGPRAVRSRDLDGSLATLVPPIVQEISPTGSGDVLLACVLDALFMRRLPLREAIAFAIPYAAANAAHPDIAEFPLPPPRP